MRQEEDRPSRKGKDEEGQEGDSKKDRENKNEKGQGRESSEMRQYGRKLNISLA